MDAVVAGLLIEGAKLAAQVFLGNMKAAGVSPAEADMVFAQEKAKFDKNIPEGLLDV